MTLIEPIMTTRYKLPSGFSGFLLTHETIDAKGSNSLNFICQQQHC